MGGVRSNDFASTSKENQQGIAFQILGFMIDLGKIKHHVAIVPPSIDFKRKYRTDQQENSDSDWLPKHAKHAHTTCSDTLFFRM
ncbi:hypothetical protein PENTCL1PPCAC_8865 [Pristionchus entomophagus]|uniref:Uncharacterized protein n=1 Tax=Pristionchus entomophagus TaxID=358040 RepID=A0AAV5SUE2_9BILA|nr:hypothetical protein PENTCL1PPCAC_8865 [Pristionchus entomophagus]